MQGKPGSPVHLLVCGLMTLALSFFNYLMEMKKKKAFLCLCGLMSQLAN